MAATKSSQPSQSTASPAKLQATTNFRLSKASREKLAKCHPDLRKVVERAIQLTTVDFKVGETLRTAERQKQLVQAGASQTPKSRHLAHPRDGLSRAVDLIALVDGKVSWDWPLYYKIADAMLQASRELGISITWGGNWQLDSTRTKMSATELANAYRGSFADGPHFQLSWATHP